MAGATATPAAGMSVFRATCDTAAVAEDDRARYLAAVAVRSAARSGYHVVAKLGGSGSCGSHHVTAKSSGGGVGGIDGGSGSGATGGGGSNAHYTGPYSLVLEDDETACAGTAFALTGSLRDSVRLEAGGLFRIDARLYVPERLLEMSPALPSRSAATTPTSLRRPSGGGGDAVALASIAEAAALAPAAGEGAAAPVLAATRGVSVPTLLVHLTHADGAGGSRLVAGAHGTGSGGSGGLALVVLSDVFRAAAGDTLRFSVTGVVDGAGDGESGFYVDLSAARPPAASKSSDVALHGHSHGPSAAWLAGHYPAAVRIPPATIVLTSLAT